jgi:hypothetical protein
MRLNGPRGITSYMAGKRRPIIASSRESRVSVVFMVMLYVFFWLFLFFCFSPRLAGKASASCNYYWTDISQSISCRCEGKALKRAARRELCRIIRDVESRIGFRTAHAPSPLRMVGAPQPLSCPRLRGSRHCNGERRRDADC